MQKMLAINELASFRESIYAYNAPNSVIRAGNDEIKIVLCHGVFDVIHAGHLAYFEAAKKHGHKLVVSITSDRFVNKGPGRPYFSEKIRAHMIANLEIVDQVVISDAPTCTQVLRNLKPDFYVKGPDYKDKTKDVTGEIYNEEREVEAWGGRLVFTDTETFSSSTLINKFFASWSEDQQKTIDRIKFMGGLKLINSYLDKISKLKVALIGEPIIDTYRFCKPQNLSSKSPSISAEFLYEENYEGGTTAIAKHLSSFVNCVFMPEVVKKIPQKIRYIENDKLQRIFELTIIDNKIWDTENPKDFINEFDQGFNSCDMAILADFGHGLFEGRVLEYCKTIEKFVALNVQTNSSNYGFNPFTKHNNYDYLSLDVREAQIAFHDRNSSPNELFEKVHARNPRGSASLTLGKNGALYQKENETCFAPSFADNVIDATGAGDAYFAITSLFVKVGAHPFVIPFVGNVFAGLKTKIIGNKSAVSKAQFIKAVEAILK